MTTINYNSLCSLLTRPIVLLAAIVFVASITSFSAYQRITPPQLKQPDSTIISSEAKIKTSISTEEIISMDLFGTITPKKVSKQTYEEIPETKLKLILKGAFTNSDKKLASAIIAKDKTKGTQLYLVGDELPGNAILEEVHPNYVIIKRGVQLEKIVFFRNLSEIANSNKGNRTEVSTHTTQSPRAHSTSLDKNPAESSFSPNTASPKSLYEIRKQLRQQNQ